MLQRKLDGSVVGKLARCTGQLERQVRTRELAEFVNEQAELPVEIQAELDASSAAVDAACTTARHLPRPRNPQGCNPMQPHACASRLHRDVSPRLLPSRPVLPPGAYPQPYPYP